MTMTRKERNKFLEFFKKEMDEQVNASKQHNRS
jgi:hypothetical protein